MTYDTRILRLGHSPDPDDAFMWWPLVPDASGRARIDTGAWRFAHILEDIQSLNVRCDKAELEITALSIHQYPYVADRYALTSCGASLGEGYGPMVIAPAGRKQKLATEDLKKVPCIAVPGTRTTAFLALSLLLGKDAFRYEAVPFDQIIPAVLAGQYEAGLIIHEGQITYAREGLDLVVDLGKWWMDRTGLPLPLGGNAIRRDLGLEAMREICGILKHSIEYALAHRPEAVAYALKFGRGLDDALASEFVGMYVNHWTLDYGPRGRQAVSELLKQGAQAGVVPDCGTIDFVDPV